MLAALLPGLRDLRTPLAAGYAWMFAAWLSIGKENLEQHKDNGVVGRVAELTGYLGSAALIAAISFLAYLTGSLLVVGAFGRVSRVVGHLLGIKVVAWVLRLVGVHADPRVDQSSVLLDWSESASRRLRATGVLVAELMSDSHDLPPAFIRRMKAVAARHPAGQSTADGIDPGKLLAAALREYVMAEEFESLAIRLQIERELLYDAYDRLCTEAELRLSVAPPAVAIFVSAGLMWSPWWYLGLALPAVVLFQGAVLAERARARVVQALASNVIQSPVVAALLARGELPQYAQEAIEQRESQAAEACFAALAGLEEAIPRYADIRRSTAESEDEGVVRAEHEKLLGQLEASIVLLPLEHGTAMEDYWQSFGTPTTCPRITVEGQGGILTAPPRSPNDALRTVETFSPRNCVDSPSLKFRRPWPNTSWRTKTATMTWATTLRRRSASMTRRLRNGEFSHGLPPAR